MSYTVNEAWLVGNYKNLTDEEISERKIKWGFLSCQWRNKLPMDFIRRFKDKLNFEQLSYRRYMSPEIIEDLKDYWDYYKLLSHCRVITDSIIEFALSKGIESGNFWRYIPFDKIEKYSEELKNFKCRHSNMRWYLAERREVTEKIVTEQLLSSENSIDFIVRHKYQYCKLSDEYKNKLELIQKLRR
jgi:hypothetical protein